MKDEKYVKSFREFNENLNIEDSREIDYDEVLSIARERGYGDLPYGRFQDFEDSPFYDDSMNTTEYTEAFLKYMDDISLGN